MIGETGDILAHNMYAYTQNNPVMFLDPSGFIRVFACADDGYAPVSSQSSDIEELFIAMLNNNYVPNAPITFNKIYSSIEYYKSDYFLTDKQARMKNSFKNIIISSTIGFAVGAGLYFGGIPAAGVSTAKALGVIGASSVTSSMITSILTDIYGSSYISATYTKHTFVVKYEVIHKERVNLRGFYYIREHKVTVLDTYTFIIGPDGSLENNNTYYRYDPYLIEYWSNSGRH